jgi:hypothetical protein
MGSPVKRESKEPIKEELEKGIKTIKRRATKAAEDLLNT